MIQDLHGKIIGQIPVCKSLPLVATLPEDKLIIVDGGGEFEDVTIDIASVS